MCRQTLVEVVPFFHTTDAIFELIMADLQADILIFMGVRDNTADVAQIFAGLGVVRNIIPYGVTVIAPGSFNEEVGANAGVDNFARESDEPDEAKIVSADCDAEEENSCYDTSKAG